LLAAAAVATAGLGVAAFTWPGSRALALDVYLLVAGALALLAVISRTVGAQPRERATRLDRRAPRRRSDPRPAALEKLEREVGLATETAFDAHFRLRPHLRSVAAARLHRRAVDLDAPGGAAEALLGPEAWELARPDRPRPRRHDAPGPSVDEIDVAVTALEQL
jgi:hypothetical protein